MKTFATLVVASVFALPCLAANDPLTGLDFLIGQWSSGAPGTSGTDIFQRELEGHFLQRRSQSVTAAADGKAQGSMQALLTVYPTGEGDALAAIYFDNDGHVIRYNHVALTPGERVEFSNDSREPGPGFRLTYTLKAHGILNVKFEMAPPGQSSYRLIAEADEAAIH